MGHDDFPAAGSGTLFVGALYRRDLAAAAGCIFGGAIASFATSDPMPGMVCARRVLQHLSMW